MGKGANRPDLDRLKAQYRTMRIIREFEAAAEKANKEGRVAGAVHLSVGQEAVAVGVCGHLRRDDLITSTHRGHGHTIAKGAEPRAMMAELMGRAAGTCGGKGGSMHIADFKVGMLGANGVVAAGIPIAVGAAQALRLRGADAVVACFFGDGAVNRGPFLEGLNWARIYDLPVLFVCEDNGFASTTRTKSVTGGPGPGPRAESLGIPAHEVDGNDVARIDELAGELVARLRNGKGPQFLWAKTYRLKGHTAADPARYREAAEVEARWQDDPIARLRALLIELGVAAGELDALARAARGEIEDAVAFAQSAPFAPAEAAFGDVQDVGAPQP